MDAIEAQGLSKSYGEKRILREITLSIPGGRIFGLIGPSGAGKSTLLRLLDLLEPPTGGRLSILGEDALPPSSRFQLRRRMGMLLQKPVIFNRTVHENIAIGLKYRHESRDRIESRVRGVLHDVDLPGYSPRPARTLSGGEIQRVALARALVTDPEILFLDEPTANLDPPSAENLEEIILRLNREKGMTLVMSTHDMLQGQRLAGSIGVLMGGTLTQVGNSLEIFQRPASKDIARFVKVGNILSGLVTENREGEVIVDVSGKVFRAVATLQPGTRAILLFRSEDVTIDLAEGVKSSARNVFPGRIKRVVALRPVVQVVIDCGIEIMALVTASSAEDLGLSEGREVRVSVKATAIHVLPET
ncbi:MAG TPA: ABC transporter ATP-binding protein [Methanomicrobiales archaeon]|nr:ABC transporter ATP-binding protein [Methanomicrobiales archaeon]